MHVSRADTPDLDDLELYEPDDCKAFDRFWALIPALVLCAAVMSPFIVGLIALDWVRGRGARHPQSLPAAVEAP